MIPLTLHQAAGGGGPPPAAMELNMRILLIEDDRMIGAAVTQALKDASYAVDWVTDGETAIEAHHASELDVLAQARTRPLIGSTLCIMRTQVGEGRDIR